MGPYCRFSLQLVTNLFVSVIVIVLMVDFFFLRIIWVAKHTWHMQELSCLWQLRHTHSTSEKVCQKFRGNINKLPCFCLYLILLYSFSVVHDTK